MSDAKGNYYSNYVRKKKDIEQIFKKSPREPWRLSVADLMCERQRGKKGSLEECDGKTS